MFLEGIDSGLITKWLGFLRVRGCMCVSFGRESSILDRNTKRKRHKLQ